MTKRRFGNILLAFLAFGAVLLVMYGSSFLISAVSAVAGALLLGPDRADMIYNFMMDNMNLYSFLVYAVAFAMVMLWYYFAVVAPIGTKVYTEESTKRITPVCFGWIALLAFALEHATSLIVAAVAAAAPQAFSNYESMVESSGLSEYSIMWYFATLILPPLVEEIVFRGLILTYLRRAGIGVVLAIGIQAVLFGVYHGNLIQGVYAAILGIVLGYLVIRYNSLVAPMFMHFCFNLFGTLLVDLENRFLTEPVLMMLILQSIPLFVLAITMIQLRIGEKKKRRV